MASPSLILHRKLTGATRDPNFWSARVNLDLRIILPPGRRRTSYSATLGNHDDAYGWAERRKLETHPTTGAAQLVELREVVQEIPVPVYVEAEVQAPPKPLAVSPTCPMTNCWATGFRSNGWKRSSRPMKTAFSTWQITCHLKRQRPCLNWL